MNVLDHLRRGEESREQALASGVMCERNRLLSTVTNKTTMVPYFKPQLTNDFPDLFRAPGIHFTFRQLLARRTTTSVPRDLRLRRSRGTGDVAVGRGRVAPALPAVREDGRFDRSVGWLAVCPTPVLRRLDTGVSPGLGTWLGCGCTSGKQRSNNKRSSVTCLEARRTQDGLRRTGTVHLPGQPARRRSFAVKLTHAVESAPIFRAYHGHTRPQTSSKARCTSCASSAIRSNEPELVLPCRTASGFASRRAAGNGVCCCDSSVGGDYRIQAAVLCVFALGCRCYDDEPFGRRKPCSTPILPLATKRPPAPAAAARKYFRAY
uniref:Uncharacterized protein n=1 Tax=Mycena chlorophos TaxID=658473 RepID=A0ABQ0ME37_MYCCL|nr:predicted protein [Mycena chlorophos]